MGMGGFLAPFCFAYCPPLLFVGSPLDIFWNSLVSALGVMAMAGAVMGYFGGRCKWYESLLLAIGALFLLKPGFITDLIGLGTVIFIYIFQKRRQLLADKKSSFSLAT